MSQNISEGASISGTQKTGHQIQDLTAKLKVEYDGLLDELEHIFTSGIQTDWGDEDLRKFHELREGQLADAEKKSNATGRSFEDVSAVTAKYSGGDGNNFIA